MRSINQRNGRTLITGAVLLFILAYIFPARDDRTTRVILKHPVASLMEDAKVSFTTRLAKQSKTLPEAIIEYKRRYGRNPPRGFDHWWEFAKENDFKLVDEFDAVVEDLEPFWSLSGEEFRQRTYLMGHLPSIDLVRIQDGNVSAVKVEKAYVDKERGHRSLGFRRLLSKFLDKLPNMHFAVNSNAEGRILVPWEQLQSIPLTSQDPPDDVSKMLNNFTADWRGRSNVWEAYRRTCPPGSPARRLYTSYRNPNIQEPKAHLGKSKDIDDHFQFADTIGIDYDYCQNPWARLTQGHFFSDWRTIPLLSPVLSPAKPKGYADIRIPSHYYLGGSGRYTYAHKSVSKNGEEIDDMEVPWNEKNDVVFWRGATTGGGSTPPGFSPTYQRHRFLRMAHENASNNVTIVHASPLRPNVFISTTVPAKDLNNDIMDVAFVSAVGSYPGGEEELRKSHRFAGKVPLGEHWSYKYLIDLDGMSYSGRFMALMASDSAVLKATVYKEYFSNWLQPWLHYIPISSSYREIYNIHAYFSGPSASTMDIANLTVRNMEQWVTVIAERDEQLREIALAGKQWKHTLGRIVDMEVYVYRLCLEYARLWADDRDAMGFVLSDDVLEL